MGFLSLLEVASMPVLEIMLVGGLGAFMATEYCNILPEDARRSINKITFVVFIPALMFASLAKTVTLDDLISWWFMPLNVGLTFLFGGILGWIVVKLLKPEKYLEGLVISFCSAGNIGNFLMIIVPTICNEDASPFGDPHVCRSNGLSYSSFSMALGGFFIYTYTYHLIRRTAMAYKAFQEVSKEPNKDLDANEKSHLLNGAETDSVSPEVETKDHAIVLTEKDHIESIYVRTLSVVHQIVEELLSPPTIGAILGLLFGMISWLKGLLIGEGAPLHFIQESIQSLGDGLIPCITLIIGGNLTQGLKTGKLKPRVLIGVILARYVLLPLIGAATVKLASYLGFVPRDPLYQFVLMIQYTVPPATGIGTMTQLFDVGKEECSVLYLWTYLAASFALTFWSTAFMWILS